MSEFEYPADEADPDAVTPEEPTLENAVFVVLGVASTLAVLIHLALLFG